METEGCNKFWIVFDSRKIQRKQDMETADCYSTAVMQSAELLQRSYWVKEEGTENSSVTLID